MNEDKTEVVSTDYIETYKNMVKYLKVLYQDVQVLHHNIKGIAFFSNHEQLAEMYEDVGEMTDNLIELGMTIGILEPSIEESLAFKPSIEVRFYDYKECFAIVRDEFARAISLMELAKVNVPADIKNKIEEHEHNLRIWGLYKAQMVLED